MICPFATWRPIHANTGGPMGQIRGFVAHSQVGFQSLYGPFNRPSWRASTHFWISQTGQLEQYVSTSVQAWAHGPGNPFFWSSEFEGMSYNDGPQEMDGDPFTSAQIDMAGRLVAWLHGLSPFPVVVNTAGLNGQGLTPHRTLMQTACPGKLRLSQYPELVLATLRHLEPLPDIPDEEEPVVFIVNPDNEAAQYLVDTSSGMATAIFDAASNNNLKAQLGIKEVDYSKKSWEFLKAALAEVRQGK